MKRRGIVLLALTAGVCFGGLFLSDNADAASKVKIDKKHFPGKVFCEYVKKFDTNKDGYLSKKERDAVKRIRMENKQCSTTPLKYATIVDLKGMKYFPKVKSFRIRSYRLKNLKLDNLKNVEKISIVSCRKVDRKKSDEKYDFTKNKKLKEVYLQGIGSIVEEILFAKDNGIKKLDLIVPDKMKEVDLSRLSQMEELWLRDSSMVESIDLKKCISLKKASIRYNEQLTKLDFSANLNLEELTVYDNRLFSLDISKNSKLKELTIGSNYLSKLDVSQNTELQTLICSRNLIETLDISMLKKLRCLECAGLKLKELNLTGNPELEELICGYNQLEMLDLSVNKKLRSILCSGNPIEVLDVSMLPELSFLSCEYARLTSLDISKNKKLKSLHYDGNCIPSIDLDGHPEINTKEIKSMQKTQLLPLTDSVVEEGIPIDKEHFPDYALRYEVLANFDTNRDGILSEKESLEKQPLDLKKFGGNWWGRREIDCTGMEYLKGITEVQSHKETTLINNTFILNVLK